MIGFLNDERRMNVAITRARFSLIVIGNSKCLSTNETWSDYLDFLSQHEAYY